MDLITISGYNKSNGVNNGFHKWSTLINGCLIREKPTNHAYFIVVLNCGYNGGFMIYIYIYPGDPCSTLFTTWPMSHLRRYIQHVSSRNRRSLMTTPKSHKWNFM